MTDWNDKESVKQYHREWDRANRGKRNQRVYMKRWREENKGYVKAYRERTHSNRKDAYLKKTYGISLQEFEQMLEKQNSKCAVCKETSHTTKKPLVVDHCHETNKIRGLLCNKCNRGIGLFGDNEEGIGKVLTYLDDVYHMPKLDLNTL